MSDPGVSGFAGSGAAGGCDVVDGFCVPGVTDGAVPPGGIAPGAGLGALSRHFLSVCAVYSLNEDKSLDSHAKTGCHPMYTKFAKTRMELMESRVQWNPYRQAPQQPENDYLWIY